MEIKNIVNKTMQTTKGMKSQQSCKGMNRPRGSVAASGAAWNDSIDLYCTEHTERHPKRRR